MKNRGGFTALHLCCQVSATFQMFRGILKLPEKTHLFDLRNLGFSLFGCQRLGPMIGLQSLSGCSWRWPSLSTRYDKIRNSTFSGKYQKRQRPSLTSSTKTFIYILIWVVLHRCPRVANITLDKAPWSLSLKHRFLCAWSSMQLQWSNWLSQYIQYKNQIEHWSCQKKILTVSTFSDWTLSIKHWTFKLSKENPHSFHFFRLNIEHLSYQKSPPFQTGHNQSCRVLLTHGCRPDIKNNVS